MSSGSPRRRLAAALLRRDRILLPGWITGGVLLYVFQAKSIDQLYPTAAALRDAADTMAANPAMLAMTGPARALDTLGGQVAWQSASYGAVVAGLMSMMIVVRHTRVEEETGRSELVRSGAIGQLTPLAHVVGMAIAANVVLGVLVALSLIGYGLPASGSWALGAALTATGLVFTGVAAVASQLTVGARAAYAATAAAVGAAFFLRAVGDTGAEAVSRASPIGWGQATRPFADERWWPLGLSVAATLLLLAAAVRLHGRRDHGAGVWSDYRRPSRDIGLGSWGLAWRLHRGALLGWTAAVALVGVGYGSMAESADDILGDTELASDLFATRSAPVEGFLSVATLILVLLCTASGVMAAQRSHAEERAGRADPLLAGTLSRLGWSLQHGVVAALGVVVMLLVAGVATGLGYAAASGDTTAVWTLVGAATAYLPAVLTVIAVVQLAHGLGWSTSLVGWSLLGWCIVVGLFGEVLDVPDAAAAVSPLHHVATMPLEPFDAAATAGLTLTALVLMVCGQFLLRGRDLR